MNFHFTPNAGKDETALWSANDPRLFCKFLAELGLQERVLCPTLATVCKMMMWMAAESDMVLCRLRWERRRCAREARCA